MDHSHLGMARRGPQPERDPCARRCRARGRRRLVAQGPARTPFADGSDVRRVRAKVAVGAVAARSRLRHRLPERRLSRIPRYYSGTVLRGPTRRRLAYATGGAGDGHARSLGARHRARWDRRRPAARSGAVSHHDVADRHRAQRRPPDRRSGSALAGWTGCARGASCRV